MRTRFAPSPTGALHLGHAYAALFAAHAAGDGEFLVRIEDIDSTRCRAEFESANLDDLRWLGLQWPEPVLRQSTRLDAYQEALERLRSLEVLYPCFCTRQEISAIAGAPQGPEGPLYPGTCRALSPSQREEKISLGHHHAWRLDVAAALSLTGPLQWLDRQRGWQNATPQVLGDVVLARKDIATSYHLAVTVDDAAQGISLVTRGEDLFASTHTHRLLQALLGLDVPEWHHHRLICDASGKRLAKRDHARSLAALRATGFHREDVLSAIDWRGAAEFTT